jgi:hypothetical protein
LRTLAGTEALTHKDLTLGTNTSPSPNQNTTGSAATLTTSRNIDGQAFNGSAAMMVIAPGTHAATGNPAGRWDYLANGVSGGFHQ